MDQPVWLERAWAEFGVREATGRASSNRVLSYYRDAGHASVSDDAVAWCAAFASAILERSGVASPRSLRARAFLQWGQSIDAPRPGAIAVLRRGRSATTGHVGFVVGAAGDKLYLLGGNQSDAVTVAAFDRRALLGLRWPSGDRAADGSKDPKVSSDLFDHCLAHVLAMEGGFIDHPDDPGGPTNKGITLAVFARWIGRDVTASSRASLVELLRTIPDATVREIYTARYWDPSGAAALPNGLSLMQFDTAVNHGVGTAIRILQTVLDVDVDGEIGPETLAAAARQPTRVVLERYAQARRDRYRRLPHFPTFGRGWMARVDATFAAALAQTSIEQAETGDEPMPDATFVEPSRKWWGHSMTIWGAVITAFATVVPALGPLVGIDITGDLVRQAGEQLVTSVQAVAGLIGTMLTIWGRVRANQPLARRDMRVKL